MQLLVRVGHHPSRPADRPPPPRKRIVALDGRADDVLELPAAGGASVRIQPDRMCSPLDARPEVALYQLVQGRGTLTAKIVARRDAGVAGLTDDIQRTLVAMLHEAGASGVAVDVRLVDQLDRSATGKLKLVERHRDV